MTQGEAPGFKAISWKTSIFIGSDDQQEKKPKQTHQPALFRPFAPGPTSTRRRWTWRARVCCEIGEKRGEGRRRSGGRGRPSRFPLVDEDGGGEIIVLVVGNFPGYQVRNAPVGPKRGTARQAESVRTGWKSEKSGEWSEEKPKRGRRKSEKASESSSFCSLAFEF